MNALHERPNAEALSHDATKLLLFRFTEDSGLLSTCGEDYSVTLIPEIDTIPFEKVFPYDKGVAVLDVVVVEEFVLE